MPMKITGTKLPTASGKVSGELSRAEQDSILRLVNSEKKAQKSPPMTIKYAVHPPKPPKPGGGGMVAKYLVGPPGNDKPPMNVKYMVVKPPVDDGGNKPPVVARYMVVPGPIVAKYGVVPPWAGIDAHQAVINNATKNGKVSLAEATTIAKLFNRDIAHADKSDKNIRPDVAKFLKSALGNVAMSDKAKDVLFGEGGPGFTPKKPQPCYILPPGTRPGKKTDGPVYILPPTTKPGKKTEGPVYILPPTTKPGKKTDGPIYILPPTTKPGKNTDHPIYILPPTTKPTKK